MIEADSLLSVDELMVRPEATKYLGNAIRIAAVSDVKKHTLTHQQLHIRFITIVRQPIKIKINANWVFIKVENLKMLPLPKVIFIFLDNFLN
jgi:A/G-specific adenine glycosylase